ncbi:MAG: SURF1 family cytochrome oxidase biogenesis protein [Microbacterium sp.]
MSVPEPVEGPEREVEVEAFPPTLREVMLRPRWLGLLLVCLLVAGVFSWLLQWQLGRAIDTDPPEEGATEIVQPIDEIATPGEYLDESLVGQKVEVSGSWVPGDFFLVSGRSNDGDAGYWVTGHLLTSGDEPASLAVAIGWTATEDEAEKAASSLDASSASAGEVTLTGRLIADEGPVQPSGDDPYLQSRMSPAALLSLWAPTDAPVYRQFLTSADPVAGLTDAGLTAIHSPAPNESSGVNWLNLFYAAEWAVFAVFSFYLWYRLAKDAWERELEELTGVDPDALDDE